jgi:hypothetical protein
MNSIRIIESGVTSSDKKRVIRSLVKDLTIAAIWLFTTAGLTGAVFAYTFGIFLLSPNYVGLTSLSVGLATGIGAIAVFSMCTDIWEEWKLVRTDINENACELLMVRSNEAVEVATNAAEPSLAVHCGEGTLLLNGPWWQEGRFDFPTNEFTLKRLKSSGHVISIEVHGNRIPISNRNEDLLPRFTNKIPDFVQSRYFLFGDN